MNRDEFLVSFRKFLTPAVRLCLNPPAAMKIKPPNARSQNTGTQDAYAVALPRAGMLAAGEIALVLLIVVLVLIRLIGGN